MAKPNTGGYMMWGDRVRFLYDQYEGKTCMARAGDEGVVVESSLEGGFVRVKLDSGAEVKARNKVMIKI